ncbi:MULTISPECIES: SDR family NAD(P)-dependent oxidoreductase [unclassified Bradyrhizobium]|uniref:SDR family NAD(P)-dependent oxidoreductase n=1 Tax=unclassified Bradyrhizobium TaxID=2631580 RepID=UPI001BAB14C4|nr:MULTISPECIES: SDR family oxidoreductase [unclassified Bradyrhizobium]MBR1202835.1 SDR family oxidoreductase [Bradyrhizobium sp. AUGA SZCCT0124]MBR1314249.1 SDR family oxidoreductase [Bradyrhizobium sp. AUGA SZCCT0051]MBR1342733.1 SDR family oxidoreductase [Bradyrhizobium sp. AUGA SZCCT0105]MBR1352962.1 SDR family oxidoreductase [Bradyrhizobium sp. AUGA SZCCT0045]
MSTERKVAVVTGASQGIGAGLVQAFRDRNCRVVATSRSIKPAADADIVTVAGDVGAADTAEQVFKAALQRFGRVDTLVNNAGIFMAKPFTAYTQDDYASYISTNVTGFFHMTRRALELMSKQGHGHVVTITTSLVDQPMSSVPAALASLTKGALNAATRALAIEYARTGIRVNAVSPGIIKTPMHPAEAHQALAALHPVGRMGDISDIVDAVLYLDGAGFVTGEVLHVDGGQAAGHHMP